MRRILLPLLAALAAALPAPSRAQSAGLVGEWEGMMRTPRPVLVRLTLARSGDGWTATISEPSRHIEAHPVDTVQVRGDTVRLRFAGDLRGLRLRGILAPDGRVVAGMATAGSNAMPFRLARPGTPEAAALAAEVAAPFDVSHQDPDSARIITEDIPRFWAALDAATPENRTALLQSMYLDRGTPGLQDFTVLRIGDSRSLVASLDRFPSYYRAARASTLRAAEFTPQIRAAFRRMEEIYPEAVFPDVYFLVGNLSSGGTTSGRGLLIGTEVMSLTDSTPDAEMSPWMKAAFKSIDAIPHIVAHELVHYEQDYAPGNTLLRQSLNEGVADFVGELISGGHINVAARAYGDAHEAALWCEFRGQMGGTDFSEWLYNGNTTRDRPADLGYDMGYRIARAYYRRTRDKRQAVRDLLRIRDFEGFVKASGYGERFACPRTGS
ncbi:MAG: hypothetical protein JO040_04000 [Gemmatimonadetes bacterium]|nr:hypothetical protein [Gemmatimonadota bacterium]